MFFKRLLFTLLLVAAVLRADAQKVFALPDVLCKLAYKNVLALNFHKADSLLALEREKYPGNLYVDYIENYRDFLSVFLSEEEDRLERLEVKKDMRLEKMDLLPDDNPYKKLMMANINLQWAFARTKFEQFFTAALEINRAYRLITGNAERFPEFVPNSIALGVMHIMIGLVPDQYGWILSLISMEGTVEQGKAELYSVLEKGLSDSRWNYLTPEALFYLGFIELNLSPDISALNKLKPYLNKIGYENLIMDYLKISIFMHTGQTDSAIIVLSEAEKIEKNYFPFYFLDYLHAECRIRQLNPEADLYYGYFLSKFKGRNYIKDAWYKRALLSYLNNNTAGYYGYMDSVLTHGYTIIDADKNAQKMAEQCNIPPNKTLLKTRFLFDGGYYTQALKTLSEIDTAYLDSDDKLEMFYRYGRIYHRLKNYPEAEYFYNTAIEKRGNSTRYFAANSALKLAQIYESEGQYFKAEKYYLLCLDMDFDEYRNSIRGKAKDGLERVEAYLKK